MSANNELPSLRDMIHDIAYRKQRAAISRFSGSNGGAEKPRDVYHASCQLIGEHLSQFGFKFAKSGPHCRKRDGDITLNISFGSSMYNVAGEHVHLDIAASVLSSKLKKWRISRGTKFASDDLAGGQIGNLTDKSAWLQWDLADPAQRDDVIRDAIEAIHNIAFPFFARFEDLPALADHLINNDLPGINSPRAIELLMWLGRTDDAKQCGANWLNRHPDVVRAYRSALSKYTNPEAEPQCGACL